MSKHTIQPNAAWPGFVVIQKVETYSGIPVFGMLGNFASETAAVAATKEIASESPGS